MAKLSLRKGFTLLELLVVIAVIGILIAMGTVAFATAQKKSRDARRRADMKVMQDAFEQYFADNTTYAACNTMGAVEYVPSGLPVDPKNTGGYVYECNGAANTYCACALLEGEGTGNANDPAGSSTCGYAAGGDYYCVGNLQ